MVEQDPQNLPKKKRTASFDVAIFSSDHSLSAGGSSGKVQYFEHVGHFKAPKTFYFDQIRVHLHVREGRTGGPHRTD